MANPPSPRHLLDWYRDAGVDEMIGETPVDRFAASAHSSRPSEDPAPTPPPPTPREARGASPGGVVTSPGAVVQTAYSLAAASSNVEELRRALEVFDGCALKKTATNLVFYDGSPNAPIVFVGEAPGAEEDRRGLPFVGASGQLLDRMLASVGLDRTRVLITNTIFWRPPGNRPPTTTETAACLPFLERLIELVDPQILAALGGAAAKSLMGRSEGVSKLRGQWFPYSTLGLPRPVQATATYHPAYLLRSPAHKRDAWRDLLVIKSKLESA